jgi:hypothetical protein
VIATLIRSLFAHLLAWYFGGRKAPRRRRFDLYDTSSALRVGVFAALADAFCVFLDQITFLDFGRLQWLVVLVLAGLAEAIRRSRAGYTPPPPAESPAGSGPG